MQTKVSVVIPCYNHAKYLPAAVHSIVAQTYSDWDCLIIDDGSPDNTAAVSKQLVALDLRIKYLYKPNGGLSSARNFGISHAKGTYILTLDADDIFEPTFLEQAVKVLESQPAVGIVTCWGYRLFEKKKYDLFKPYGGGVKNYLFANASLASALFRKKCWEQVNGYDETMKKGYEDWDFYLGVAQLGWDTFVIPEPLFLYRQHQHSMLKTALLSHDIAIKKYLYQKHKALYIDYFDETIHFWIEKADFLKKQEIKRINSIEYKIGAIVLKPFRWIKKSIRL